MGRSSRLGLGDRSCCRGLAIALTLGGARGSVLKPLGLRRQMPVNLDRRRILAVVCPRGRITTLHTSTLGGVSGIASIAFSLLDQKTSPFTSDEQSARHEKES